MSFPVSYRDQFRRLLYDHEGVRYSVYQDQFGYWTLGVGHLVDERRGGKVSQAVVDLMLDEDMEQAEKDARSLVPGFDALDDTRKLVVASMSFQLGKTRFGLFTNTLKAINEGRWDDAAVGMRNSLWAKQTPERAEKLAQAMETGNLA